MRTYKSSVVGESFGNPDGASRQEIVRRYAKVGSPTYLIPEPTNRHDSNAVKVCLNYDGSLQIGFIPAASSVRMSREILNGYRYDANILGVHGGGAKQYGVSLEITAYTKKESKDLGPRLPSQILVSEPLPTVNESGGLANALLTWLRKRLRF